MNSQREISLKNKSGIKTYNNKLLNFRKFQLSKVITLKPYLVDKLLGTSRRDGLTRTLACTLACTLHSLKTSQAKRPYNLITSKQ